MKKQNILLGLLGAAALFTACDFENFDKRCQRESEEYTLQNCPQRIDPCTVLDSMKYDIPTRTLKYYYTLEGLLDSANVLTDAVVGDFREELKKDVVNSLQLKKYKEQRINFNYIYYSKATGKTSIEIKISPEEYSPAASEK